MPFAYAIVFFPLSQVINDRFGIVEGLMTTVHSITGINLNLISFNDGYEWEDNLFFLFYNTIFLKCCLLLECHLQLLRRPLMVLQPRTGEVEELLHSTLFPAVLELPR